MADLAEYVVVDLGTSLHHTMILDQEVRSLLWRIDASGGALTVSPLDKFVAAAMATALDLRLVYRTKFGQLALTALGAKHCNPGNTL